RVPELIEQLSVEVDRGHLLACGEQRQHVGPEARSQVQVALRVQETVLRKPALAPLERIARARNGPGVHAAQEFVVVLPCLVHAPSAGQTHTRNDGASLEHATATPCLGPKGVVTVVCRAVPGAWLGRLTP